MIEFTLSCGDVATGIWCGKCALPSGESVDVAAISENGVTRPVAISGCPDCGTSADV